MILLQYKNFNTENALRALKDSREEGLEFLFNEFYTSLSYFANSLLQDQCLAEEIASETFLKLWEHREDLTLQGSIKTWLYTTVRNACIDHLRKVKRLRVSQQGLQTASTIEQSVLHSIIEAETINHIVQTIDKLPPQCGKIFRLFYLHGKSYREIAAELNLSPQTVRNQKQRAAKLLKKMVLPLLIWSSLLL